MGTAICKITVTHYAFVYQSFHTSATLIAPYSCLTKYIIHPTKSSHHFTDEVSEPQRGEIYIPNLSRGACFPSSSLPLPSLSPSLPPFLFPSSCPSFLSSYSFLPYFFLSLP